MKTIGAFARASWRVARAKAAVACFGAAVVVAACGPGLPTEQGIKDELYGNFQTAVASDRNYDVYWLGRSFEAGGLTYEGPEASAPAGSDRLGAGINPPTADRIQMSYLAPACIACPGIEVTLFSREAWDMRGNRSERPSNLLKAVDFNGRTAQLWTRLDPNGQVSIQTLVIDYGRTVVEATASPFSHTLPADGDVAVQMDEATFLAAMQKLRPYPE